MCVSDCGCARALLTRPLLMLQDIAIVTGAEYIAKDLGLKVLCFFS